MEMPMNIPGLPEDQRLLSAQFELIKQREVIMTKKSQLYEQFRAFALKMLQTYGNPFQVKFRSLNGDASLKFRELEMGEEFFLIFGEFTFDPKTNLITNYMRNEFSDIKTEDDLDKMFGKATEKLRSYGKIQQPIDCVTNLEKNRIDKKVKEKVNEILRGIFNGELSFDDPAFRSLIEMNAELEQALKELDIRISALRIINSSSKSNINIENSKPNMHTKNSKPNIHAENSKPNINTKNSKANTDFESPIKLEDSQNEQRSDNRRAIIDFLKSGYAADAESANVGMALQEHAEMISGRLM